MEHFLTESSIKNRVVKCKRPLQELTDSKHQTILKEEALKLISRVEWGYHPVSIMVWWDVSYASIIVIHSADILAGILKSPRQFKSALESVPAHKARWTQTWPESHNWPSARPDLNPLGYKLSYSIRWHEYTQLSTGLKKH